MEYMKDSSRRISDMERESTNGRAAIGKVMNIRESGKMIKEREKESGLCIMANM